MTLATEPHLDEGTDAETRRGDATGVVLSWKREKNIPEIVRGLLAQDWVKRVIVWDNAGRSESSWTAMFRDELGSEYYRRVDVAFSKINIFTYARFEAAAMAKTPLIATVDDDWLCGIWNVLRDTALDNPGKIVHALDEGHFVNEANGKRPWAQVGWGAVFPKSTVEALAPYINRWGRDEVLMRKADRIWSVLVGSENHLALPAKGKMLPGATSQDALYRRQDHNRMTNVAVTRALHLLGKVTEAELRNVESRMLGK